MSVALAPKLTSSAPITNSVAATCSPAKSPAKYDPGSSLSGVTGARSNSYRLSSLWTTSLPASADMEDLLDRGRKALAAGPVYPIRSARLHPRVAHGAARADAVRSRAEVPHDHPPPRPAHRRPRRRRARSIRAGLRRRSRCRPPDASSAGRRAPLHEPAVEATIAAVKREIADPGARLALRELLPEHPRHHRRASRRRTAGPTPSSSPATSTPCGCGTRRRRCGPTCPSPRTTRRCSGSSRASSAGRRPASSSTPTPTPSTTGRRAASGRRTTPT